MTILSVDPVKISASYEYCQRTYSADIRVVADSQIGVQAAIAATNIPFLSPFATAWGDLDNFAVATHFTASPEDIDARSWIVTVEYGPYDPRNTCDPLLAVPEVAWSLVSWGEKPLTEDINGNPVRNSAYDPFDPPWPLDDLRPHLSVVRNEASFDAGIAAAYTNTLNNDTWLGFEKGAVKCSNISGQRAYDMNASTIDGLYWSVTYEFDVDVVNKWKAKIPNLGLRSIDLTSTPHKQVAITEKGSPITSPKMLTTSGQVLTDPSAPNVYLTFDVYSQLDFSVFGF